MCIAGFVGFGDGIYGINQIFKSTCYNETTWDCSHTKENCVRRDFKQKGFVVSLLKADYRIPLKRK
jgi:hypothetical protein